MEAQALERDEQAGAGVSNVEAPAPGFAKRKNRGHIRKRPADEADGAAAPAADGELADGAAPAVARRSKAAKEAPLAFTTRREGGGDAGAGPRLEAFKYESARTLQQASDMGATRGNQQETAFDRDARRAPPPVPPPALRGAPVPSRQLASPGLGTVSAAPGAGARHGPLSWARPRTPQQAGCKRIRSSCRARPRVPQQVG